MMKSILTLLLVMFLMGSVLGQTPADGSTLNSNASGAAVVVALSFPTPGGNFNTSQSAGYTVVGSLPSGITLTGNNVATTLISASLTLPAGSSGTVTLNINYRIGATISNLPVTYTIAVNTPLAVELVDFKANLTDKKVALNWLTAKEENVNFFSIERSKNGLIYAEVAQVKTGSFKNDYAFVDEKPLVGTNYYRLKMTDRGSQIPQYSKVITIATQNKGIMRAFPSIVSERVTIDLPESKNETILNIFDYTGKIVQTQKTNAIQVSLDVSSLVVGHYFIVAQNDSERLVEKFVKQ